jgi:AcrR family transcriptional regulator
VYVPAVVGNLRERKKTRLRQTIVREALRLFAERGFTGTTVDDIAGAADVSRRTFFRYFDHKEDVLLGWLDEVGEDVAACLAARPHSEPPLDAVRASVLTLVEGYRERAADALAGARVIESTPAVRAREREKQGEWEDAIANELCKRLGRSIAARRRARLLAALSVGALSASIAIWRAEAGRPDLADLVRDAFDLLAPQA